MSSELPGPLKGIHERMKQTYRPVGFDPLDIHGQTPAHDLVSDPANSVQLEATSARHLISDQLKNGTRFITVQPVYSFVVNDLGKSQIDFDLVRAFCNERKLELKDSGIFVYKYNEPLFLSNRQTSLPNLLLGFADEELFEQFVGWLRMAVFAVPMSDHSIRQMVVRTGTKKIVDPLAPDDTPVSTIKVAIPYGEGGWIPKLYVDRDGHLHIDY